MLKKETAPFLFTLIIAVLGWLLTRAIEDAAKAPTLAYSKSSFSEGTSRIFAFRLRNVSSDVVFRNFNIVLTGPDEIHSHFLWADILYAAPIHPDKSKKQDPSWKSSYVICFVPELQPGTELIVKAKVDGDAEPVLRFDCPTPLHLVRAGALSFAIENLSEILISLAVALFLTLIPYSVLLSKTS